MLVVSSRSGGGLEPPRLCSTSPLLPRERNLPREATNSPTVNTRDGKHTRCPLIWSSISWPWEEGEIITEPFHINSLNVIIWGFLVIQKLSHCHIVIVIVICNCNATIALRTPQVLFRVRYQKTKPNCIVSYSFSNTFSYYEQKVSIRVSFGPTRSFLSWLRGRHQFPCPASEFSLCILTTAEEP